MSLAPIYDVCAADATVLALIPDGNADIRLYPFGEAPEGVLKPYVVWQRIGGSPENYLTGRPDVDGCSLQVDVYGDTAASVLAVSVAIRYAIELKATITGFGPQDRDPDTKTYRDSFDVDWFVYR
ncbi:DUF3168 domain-containing protein [Pseudomonas typographi]|uniref:DUF3168 domain-containing protein n=1 Tax=Pseudomonas typographi TaxID=2715964 RepID=UPI001684ED88|nr:DUF3168 domain-containing protein [Pseudomonas typographi]MBD1589667.1 DUF3168 domain-containing protein [Pseudomonas typographi]